MPFSDPLVAGEDLIRSAIRSPNFDAGNTGWIVRSDGSAEFNDITARGDVTSSGIGSFDSLTIATDNVEIAGVQLSDRLAAQAAGILVFGYSSDADDTTTTEKGVFEIAFEAPTSKYYQLSMGAWLAGPMHSDLFLQVRDGGSDKPSLTSDIVLWIGHSVSVDGIGEQFGVNAPVYLTAGTHRLLLSFGNYGGTAGTVTLSTSTVQPVYMQVTDTPNSLTNLAVANDGSGGSSSPVQTYTTSWNATWSGSYNGSNSYISYFGNEVHQGYYSSSNGNQRGLIGFDSAAITTELSGATILGCSVTLYAFHWYYNAGGTAVLGTHGHSSLPGTFSATSNRTQSGSWPKPGLRTVDLGTGIGAEFQAGTTKGIALGPGPSNDYIYYGKFNGYGATYAPVLTITYEK